MIDRLHGLPVVQQCKILSLSLFSSTAYYKPLETSRTDLALKRRINALHLSYPFAGSDILSDLLGQDGFAVGRKHVATPLKTMCKMALYKKPYTNRRYPAHLNYPNLLRHMEITRPQACRGGHP